MLKRFFALVAVLAVLGLSAVPAFAVINSMDNVLLMPGNIFAQASSAYGLFHASFYNSSAFGSGASGDSIHLQEYSLDGSDTLYEAVLGTGGSFPGGASIGSDEVIYHFSPYGTETAFHLVGFNASAYVVKTASGIAVSDSSDYSHGIGVPLVTSSDGSLNISYTLTYPVLVISSDGSSFVSMQTFSGVVDEAISAVTPVYLGDLLNNELPLLSGFSQGSFAKLDLVVSVSFDTALVGGESFFTVALPVTGGVATGEEDFVAQFADPVVSLPAPVQDVGLGGFLANTVNGVLGATLFEMGGVPISLGTMFGGVLAILILVAVLKWLGV